MCAATTALLLNIFFAAVMEVVLQRFGEDDTILDNLLTINGIINDIINVLFMVFLDEERGGGPDETLLDRVRRAVWGMLHADDAGIVSRPPARLVRMIGGYRRGVPCVWLDRVGEEDGGCPDAGTGEGAAAGGDTNTTSTGAGDRSSRPEVQPGPPVRIPGRPHYRRRRPHARYQAPHQNRLEMLQEVRHRALRPGKLGC